MVEHYKTQLSFTKLRWTLLNSVEPYWTQLNFTKFSWTNLNLGCFEFSKFESNSIYLPICYIFSAKTNQVMCYVFSLRHIKKSTWELFQGCDDYIKVEKSGLSRGGVVVNWRWFLWVPLEVKAASQSPHALLQWFRQNRIFNYNVSSAKLLFPAVFVLVLGSLWDSHGRNNFRKTCWISNW